MGNLGKKRTELNKDAFTAGDEDTLAKAGQPLQTESIMLTNVGSFGSL